MYFFLFRGLQVSDRKIKAFSFFWARIACLSLLDSSGTSLLLSVRTQPQTKKKKKTLSTHEWAVSTSVCVCLSVILLVWLLYWHCSVIFDSNDVGPSQIDRRRRREWEQEWETRQEENESIRAWEEEKLSNSGASVDNSRLWFCKNFSSFSVCLLSFASGCFFFFLSVNLSLFFFSSFPCL